MYKTKGGFQLTLQTLSLVVGFMAWSIIAPLMPFIKQDVNVTEGQISIILAIPVIFGISAPCAIWLFNKYCWC